MNRIKRRRFGAHRRAGAAVGILLASIGWPAAASAANARPTTVLKFKQAVALKRVAAALHRTETRPLSFTHTGSTQGGYRLGAGESLDVAVRRYRRTYSRLDGGSPRIISVTLRGAVRATALGALAARVDRTRTTPAVAEELPVRDGTITPAGSSHSWAPLYGTLVTTDIGGDLPRDFEHSLLWENQASIDDFGADAYEHDLKLYNTGNPGFLYHPACFGWQDNFWAQREGIYWETTLPADTSPYFDELDQSDACETQDFTVGMLYPQFLEPQVQYSISILAKAGEESQSDYELSGQKLSIICDSPACVNLPGPLGHPGEGQPLIGQTVGEAPECRSWHKGESSVPCA